MIDKEKLSPREYEIYRAGERAGAEKRITEDKNKKFRLSPEKVMKSLEAMKEKHTVEEIRREMGVSRPTFYHWYNGRIAPYKKEKGTIMRAMKRFGLMRRWREIWES